MRVLTKDTKTGTKGAKVDERHESIAKEIVDAAYKVFVSLGPMLLESAYELALAHELRKRGHRVETQVPVFVTYDGVQLGVGFKIDLLVEEMVIVELKSIEATLGVHESQTLTYMRLADKKMGFLINFGVRYFKDGVKRFVR